MSYRILIPSCVVGALLFLAVSTATAEEPTIAAAWELRLLGVDSQDRLKELHVAPQVPKPEKS